MTSTKKKAPAATGAIKNRSTNLYEGVPMPTTVAQAAVNGQTTTFDTTMKVPVNHGGGTVTMRASFSEWLGQHDVHLYIGDRVVEGVYLAPDEARGLAAALLSLAQHIDEEQPREIRRSTEPGQPEQHGIGGGL